MSDETLRDEDRQTRTWALVQRKCGDIVRQATARALSTGLDAEKTEYERGRVAAARSILGLDPNAQAAERPPKPE